ncbi:MAG TPA: hypothetical protein VJ299_03720, partial [Steroidobacteraceae bacterium]|nr:hypothetical protein [Steroidobacteraceae bacterium]
GGSQGRIGTLPEFVHACRALFVRPTFVRWAATMDKHAAAFNLHVRACPRLATLRCGVGFVYGVAEQFAQSAT